MMPWILFMQFWQLAFWFWLIGGCHGDEKVVLDKYTIIEGKKPIREVYNWLQHFIPEMIHDVFESAGLIIKDYFANVAGGEFNLGNDEFAIQANYTR